MPSKKVPLIDYTFQSTPPEWEATSPSASAAPSACSFQSTPPGWEATLLLGKPAGKIAISIHASRVGGDVQQHINAPIVQRFQSTPPRWEATILSIGFCHFLQFQSMPPGWEATIPAEEITAISANFNPRLPGGRRPAEEKRRLRRMIFQSTPPGWEAT